MKKITMRIPNCRGNECSIKLTSRLSFQRTQYIARHNKVNEQRYQCVFSRWVMDGLLADHSLIAVDDQGVNQQLIQV